MCNQHINVGMFPPRAGVAADTFTTVLQLLAYSQCWLAETWPPQASLSNSSSVDVIIVGAGTAGSALAARLAETNLTVLLLEAGDDPPLESIVPGFQPFLYHTQYDWNLTTLNDRRSSQELMNNRQQLRSGRLLGGSGSINHMVSGSAFPADFDEWADTLGDATWNWNNVLPYFKKNDKSEAVHHYYELDGKINVSRLVKQNPDTIALTDAFAELGFDIVEDHNAENVPSNHVYNLSFTIRNGKRQSSLTAMLNKVAAMKNLIVLKNALVTKILIKDHTAYGVKVLIGGDEWEFYANKEVIISAGVYNTPKLLMLSGIGDIMRIQTFGIKLVQKLRDVGKDLQDSLTSHIFLAADSGTCYSDEDSKVLDVAKYLFSRTGSLSVPNGIGVDYILRNTLTPDVPDFRIFPTCIPKGSDYLNQCLQTLDYTLETCLHLDSINKKFDLFPISVIMLKPKSRGLVTLSSADPLEPPYVYSGAFLTEEEDLDSFLEVMGVVKSLVNTTHFRSKNAFVVDLELKSCEGLEWPEDVKCMVKSTIHSGYNGAGTAAMGTVLDTRMRVVNVNGLRVVDASAMPTVPRFINNEAVIMLAEKAADFIKEDYCI